MISKIKEFIYENEKTIIIIIVLLIAGVVACDVFGKSDVSDNTTGVTNVRTGLTTTATEQRAVSAGLDNIAKGIDTSTGQSKAIAGYVNSATINISSTQIRLGTDQNTLTDSGAILKRDLGILQQVRARGTVGN
jgi:predicted negative regulator of RcsB-dependent stress response